SAGALFGREIGLPNHVDGRVKPGHDDVKD
ncbi:MAG: hypothetical protein JWO51_4894, partial [Rhodospirillales bacterium]|nr:hypothetical protein [Rhodospirillales bacterium]